MKKQLLGITLGAALGAATLGGTALASGPGGGGGNGSGNNGRGQIVLDCGSYGTLTVAVPNGGNSRGAGQIVDAKGHGIPVSGTFTLTDTTTNTVIDSGPFGGAGHQNQTATECTGTVFTGVASDVFGPDLPPGVAATDTISGSIDAWVVIKL